MASRRTRLGVLVALLAAPAILFGYPAAERNRWSLDVLRWTALPLGSAGALPAAPAVGHPREALWEGRAALRRGDVAAARALLAPRADPLALASLAAAQDAAGDAAAAAQTWKRASAWPALLAAAQRALAAGRWDAAAQYADAASDGAPQAAVEARARALLHLQDPQAAASAVDAALRRWPRAAERPEWLLLAGDFEGQSGHWDAAIAALEQAAAPDSPYRAQATAELALAL